MIPNVLPVQASHSSMEIFERPPLLITSNTSFEQKTGPVYAPNGATLKFEVVGDRTNFVELQNIYLEVKCRILIPNGDKLEYDAGNASANGSPFFVNNTLHSLFFECSITANGIKIPSANGNYGQKAFNETEFSHNKEAKDTWLKCQGYSYEEQPDDFTKTVFTTRTAETRESAEISFFGRIASDCFSCDKLLKSWFTLRILFLRNRPEYALIYDDESNEYKIKNIQASLYGRKMTLSDNVYSAIETTLTKTPALSCYTKIIPETFLISTEVQKGSHVDVFPSEPIGGFALAMQQTRPFWEPSAQILSFSKNSITTALQFIVTVILLAELHCKQRVIRNSTSIRSKL